MKKERTNTDDGLRPEYDLKTLKVRRLGPGWKRFGEFVRLEPDVAEAFPNADSVNEALRSSDSSFQRQNSPYSQNNLTRLMKLPAGKLFGKNLRTRQVAGLRLAEVLYLPGYTTPKHSHDLPQLCLVRKGIFTEVYDGKTRQVRRCSLIARPSGESHTQRFLDSEAHCLIVEFEQRWLERVREYQVSLDYSLAFDRGLSVWLATRLFAEFQLADELSSLSIEGLALEVMVELSRQHSKMPHRNPPGWLKQTKELLHSRFLEPLTLDSIAKSVGTHPVHLARAFRQHYHCTIGEYTRRLRVEFACSEISATDSSLAEIASRTGFYDQSHFSRTFKRIVGVTPGEYRTAFRSR